MAYIVNIITPIHNTFNAKLFKAYNFQILEIHIVASTLPNGSGHIEEPYAPIIQLRRQIANPSLQTVSPDRFIRHSEVQPYGLPFYQKFIFRINLEDVQIKTFNNDDSFLNLGVESFTKGVSNTFYYLINYWDSSDLVARPNPDNLLMQRTDYFAGGFFGVYNLNSINAQFRFSNFVYLTPFLLTNLNRPALTKKPYKRVVCLNDSEYLTFCLFNFGGNAMKVDLFNELGQLIDRGIVKLDLALGGSIGESTRLGVGPANINDITGAYWFPVPGGFPFSGTPTISANIAYYEITVGYYSAVTFDLQSSPSARPTATYRFYVKSKCCNKRYRVHFINQFGADDVVTFEDNEVIEYQSSDEFFERNLPLVFSTKDRAKIQLIKEAQKIITLRKDRITKEESEWLTELQLSPNTLVEIDGVWYAYYIEAGKQTVSNTDDDFRSIEITLLITKADSSQRN